MRIATSTIYAQQTAAIDNQQSLYAEVGQQLASGKQLNSPSDAPEIIQQDLVLRATIQNQDDSSVGANNAKNELTLTDATLSSLTDLLQTARGIAVAAATNVIPNGTQRQYQATEIDGLLQRAIGLANAKYGDHYIFSGTGSNTAPPVTPQGSPANNVLFSGNSEARTTTVNGQTFTIGTTLQQGFNYGSTDGTQSAFTLLATLRDTLNNDPVVDASLHSVNVAGSTIYGAGSAAPTTLAALSASPSAAQTQLVPDSAGKFGFIINGVNATGAAQSATFQFTNATAVDDGTATSVIGQINAQTINTGVKAKWDFPSQRLILSSVNATEPFSVGNAPTLGATNTANFTEVFGLQNQADIVNNISTQLGDVDKVLSAVLKTRADVGTRIQNLGVIATQTNALSVNNTAIQSGYEDTNIPSATSKFTQTQTALQAAYATTTRLEGKQLFDYL